MNFRWMIEPRGFAVGGEKPGPGLEVPPSLAPERLA